MSSVPVAGLLLGNTSASLGEVVVHVQDIRRPLGIARTLAGSATR